MMDRKVSSVRLWLDDSGIKALNSLCKKLDKTVDEITEIACNHAIHNNIALEGDNTDEQITNAIIIYMDYIFKAN